MTEPAASPLPASSRSQARRWPPSDFESIYRTVFEKSPDYIYLTDAEGTILDANPALLKRVGLSLEEMRQKNVVEFFPGDSRDGLLEVLGRLRNGEEVKGYQVKARTFKGEVFEYEVNAIPVQVDGRFAFCLNVARDISERSRAREALWESKKRFRSVFTNMSVGVALVGVDRRLLAVNWARCRFLGYAEDELVGMHLREFTFPKDLSRDAELFAELLEGRRGSYTIEKRYVRKDGAIVWGRLSISLVRDEGGRPQYALCVCEDITARKQAEEALRESEARLQAIFDATKSVAFITTDLAGMEARIVDFSPGAERIFGYTAREAIGQPAAILHLPKDVAWFPKSTEALRQGKDELTAEMTLLRKSGETIPALLTLYPLFGERGELNAVLGVTIDITGRKRAEQALEESEGKLRDLLSSIDDLVFGLDREGRFVFCHNPSHRELYLPAERFLGQKHAEIMPPHLNRLFSEAFERNKRGEVAEYEYPLEIGGEERWFAAKLSPMFGDCEFSGSVAVIRDVTERKKAEEAVEESEQRYRNLFRGAPISLWEVDLSEVRAAVERLRRSEIVDLTRYFEDHPEVVAQCAAAIKVCEVNEAILTLCGAQCKADLLSGVSQLFAEDSYPTLTTHLLALAEGRTTYETETVARSLTGESKVVVIRWTVAPGHEGTWSKVLVSVIDVTERRQLEREVLEIGQYERRRVGQELHDYLGQTLTGIALMGKLLEDKLAVRSLPEAAEAGEMTRLVNDALSKTRALARGFCPVSLAENGLTAALEQLASDAGELFGIQCGFRCCGPVSVADHDAALLPDAPELIDCLRCEMGAQMERLILNRPD